MCVPCAPVTPVSPLGPVKPAGKEELPGSLTKARHPQQHVRQARHVALVGRNVPFCLSPVPGVSLVSPVKPVEPAARLRTQFPHNISRQRQLWQECTKQVYGVVSHAAVISDKAY